MFLFVVHVVVCCRVVVMGDCQQACSMGSDELVKGRGISPVHEVNSVDGPSCGPGTLDLKKDTSQLEGPTPPNSYGFRVSQSALQGSHDLHDVRKAWHVGVALLIGCLSGATFDMFLC